MTARVASAYEHIRRRALERIEAEKLEEPIQTFEKVLVAVGRRTSLYFQTVADRPPILGQQFPLYRHHSGVQFVLKLFKVWGVRGPLFPPVQDKLSQFLQTATLQI